MEKYNLFIRVFIGVPILCIAFIFWVFILLFSSKKLGKVLKETGENLLKP